MYQFAQNSHFSFDDAGVFHCPNCPRKKKEPKHRCVRHLLCHLKEEDYYPYKCTVPSCPYVAMDITLVMSHVRSRHKLEWTENVVRFFIFFVFTRESLEECVRRFGQAGTLGQTHQPCSSVEDNLRAVVRMCQQLPQMVLLSVYLSVTLIIPFPALPTMDHSGAQSAIERRRNVRPIRLIICWCTLVTPSITRTRVQWKVVAIGASCLESCASTLLKTSTNWSGVRPWYVLVL